MSTDLDRFKARALARPAVKREYDRLAEEFEYLDEILKARTASGLTQADVAARIGTTQSAIARLESPGGKHSPSIATLRRYASALGYRLQLRLVHGGDPTRKHADASGKRTARKRAPETRGRSSSQSRV